MRTGFWNTAKLGLAYDFYTADGKRYSYPPTLTERVGISIGWVQETTLHQLFKQITHPAVIAGLTLTAWGVISIAIYPRQSYAALTAIVPAVRNIQSWHLKATLYWSINFTILGIGLRAIGRYRNTELVRAWKEEKIHPIFIGAKPIPLQNRDHR